MAMQGAPLPAGRNPKSIGISKRRELDDRMKRRRTERMLREVFDAAPQLLRNLGNKQTKIGPRESGVPSQPVDAALTKQYAPAPAVAPRGGGGGVPNGAVTGVYPGSPNHPTNWQVPWTINPEGLPSTPSGGGNFAGNVVLGQESPERHRERIRAAEQELFRWQEEENYPAMKELQARIDNAGGVSGGVAVGGTAPPAAPTVDHKALLAAQTAASKARNDGDEATARLYDAEAARLMAAARSTTAPTRPPADMANRGIWQNDPEMQTAILTNNPQTLAAGRAAEAKFDPALALKYTQQTAQPGAMLQPSHVGGQMIPVSAEQQVAPAAGISSAPVERTLKNGTKVKVIKNAAGQWEEVG